MTREIKFRAWDKRFKKFDYGGGALLLRHNSDDFEEAQQYTGLKDKNGKEIYEGDIVKCNYCDKDFGKVYWDKAMLMFKLDFGKEHCGNAYHTSINHWAEVIGNIYENPELLTNE